MPPTDGSRTTAPRVEVGVAWRTAGGGIRGTQVFISAAEWALDRPAVLRSISVMLDEGVTDATEEHRQANHGAGPTGRLP